MEIIDDSKNVIIQEITAKICASCEALGKAFLGDANSTVQRFLFVTTPALFETKESNKHWFGFDSKQSDKVITTSPSSDEPINWSFLGQKIFK